MAANSEPLVLIPGRAVAITLTMQMFGLGRVVAYYAPQHVSEHDTEFISISTLCFITFVMWVFLS